MQSPEVLWTVIAVLGVALLGALALLLFLYLRERRADRLWNEVTETAHRLGYLSDRCSLLAYASGRGEEFTHALTAVALAQSIPATRGNVRWALKLAHEYQALLKGWIAELERPLEAQTAPRQPVADFLEASVGEDGSCTLCLHLPWKRAGKLVFVLTRTQCSMIYEGTTGRLLLGDLLLLNLPDVQHPLTQGMNVITVRKHGVAAGWEPPTLRLRLLDMARPR